MTTNVQASDEVREQIEELKKSWGLKSYDEVIKRTVRAQTGKQESLFRAARGSKSFRRDTEDEH
jgi:predicted CopG family antitoxin